MMRFLTKHCLFLVVCCLSISAAFSQNTYNNTFAITGPTSICPNGTTTYIYSGPIANLSWSVTGGQFVGSNTGASVSVKWNSGNGSLSATGSEQECWTEPDIYPPVTYCNTYNYTSDPFNVSSLNPPQNVGGGGSVCSVSPSGVSITLSGSLVNYTYQLKRDGVSVGSPVNGTGGVLTWTNQVLPGAYTIQSSGACPAEMSGTAYITQITSVGGNISANVSGILSLSGHAGNVVRWEKNSGSGWATISNTTTLQTYGSITTPTWYRAWVVNGACAGAYSSEATVYDQRPPSEDQNFVRTETILVTGILQENQIAPLPVDKKTTVYQYIDGLGRNLQSVTQEGSPIKADVVLPFVYDQYGRQAKELLPYVYTDVKGKFRTAAFTEQTNFYTTPPTAVATAFKSFTEKIFEASPLNRVVDVVSPRDDNWNATAKKITTLSKLNQAGEVVFWKDFISGLPERNGTHAANTLTVQETIDEEGKITKTYQNPRGQTVMSRVGDGTNWFDTHYVYSPIGLLMFVIQPEGVARLVAEFDPASAADKQLFLDRWAFQYQYDSELRPIAKRVPGYAEGTTGWFYTVFDRWNRVVLTQDPEQRTRNEYSFTKYDRFNRPIITGLYVTATSLATLRTNAANAGGRFETEKNDATGYHLNLSFPTSGVSEANLLTVNYYDNYAFVSYTGWDAEANSYAFVNVSGYPQSTDLLTTVKGYPTGSKVRVLGQTKWLNAVTHYDKNYRSVQAIAEHHLGGVIRTTSQFDFVGNVTKEQVVNSHAGLTVQQRYAYDHAGRLMTVHHQVNSQPEILMLSNKYNELGQLIEKNIHSTDGVTFLQSIDHRYNIKGWLTSINNTSFTQTPANDDTNDLFGMELQYYVQTPVSVGATGDVLTQKSLYDGNISAIKWKTDTRQGTTPEERIYVFDYDVLSRLKKAHYAKNTATSSSPSWTGDSGMFDETIHAYDKNGNIKVIDGAGNPLTALTRNGRVQNAKGIVDELKYGYRVSGKHSNRLVDIDDTGNYTLGFKSASASVTEEFQYDKNGNLKFDHNKSISALTYNHLNLVKEVQFTRPGGQVDKIEYTYDATGIKLSQVVRINGTQVWKTDYVGGMQYDNNSLSFFATAEGRVVKTNGTFDYEYFLKDHQGNTRVVYGPLKETRSYRATMESPGGSSTLAQREETDFVNVALTRHQNASFNYTPPSEEVVVPDRSARCNGYSGYSAVGPAKMFAVSNGDKVYMETYAKYNQVTGSNAVVTAAALLSAFTSPFGIVNSGETATLYQSFNSSLPGVSAGMGSSTTVPKAYLVWLFFDSNKAYVRSGGQAITASAYNAFEKLSRSFTADRNGYLYVYVANESSVSAAASVYFDETYIVHEKNNITLQVLQASDYYPFGLSFNQYQADRLKEVSAGNYAPELRNRYLFQGQEIQKDLDLGWYQFKWRMHDPAIGRFGAVDPLSEKYAYNSPFAFQENKTGLGIELEGKELLPFTALSRAGWMTRLSRNLEKHHLIPRQLKGDKLVEYARRNGFKFEGKENKIELEKFSAETGKGQHGNHPKYNEHVGKQLRELQKENPNPSPQEATKMVRDLAKNLEEAIKANPETKINDLFELNRSGINAGSVFPGQIEIKSDRTANPEPRLQDKFEMKFILQLQEAFQNLQEGMMMLKDKA